MTDLQKNKSIKKLLAYVRSSRRVLVPKMGGRVSEARDLFFSRLFTSVLSGSIPRPAPSNGSDVSEDWLARLLNPLPDFVARARRRVDSAIETDADIVRMIAEDPTNLGWAYQFWNEAERDDTTWAISRRDDRDSVTSIPVATQIFTEDYMASFVIDRCVSALDQSNRMALPSVLDPACGAGHMLAHAVRRVRVRSHICGRELVKFIHGCDIDGDAVDICRVVLLLELSRSEPESVSAVWRCLVETIRVLKDPKGTLNRDSDEPILSQAYSCVVTNPPYIGRRKMPVHLRSFLRQEYPETWMDLCSAFMQRCVELTQPGGMLGLVTVDKWLRLKGYEALRTGEHGIYRKLALDMVCELGQRAFHSWSSLHDGVGIALLTARRDEPPAGHFFHFLSCTDQKGPAEKEFALTSWRKSESGSSRVDQRTLLDGESSTGFVRQNGLPATLVQGSRKVRDCAHVLVGLQTSDDQRFVKYVWSVPPDRERWKVHGKGGGSERWYGLNRFLLDWGEGRTVFESDTKSGIRVESWFEREGWTYSWFANGVLSLRRKERGWSFGRAASTGFFCNDPRIAGFLNTRVASLAVRRQGGKAQLPEGVVRALALPDSLEAIDARLVDAAVNVKRALVEGEITDATFRPREVFDPIGVVRAQAALLVIEGELERQVVESLGMSESERRSLDEVMGCPVSWAPCGEVAAREWRVDALPSDVRAVCASIDISRPRWNSSAKGIERVHRYFDECPRVERDRRSLPGGALVEHICRWSGLHPLDVARALEELLSRDAHVRRDVLGPMVRSRIVEEVLTAVGHQWWSVTEQYDPSVHVTLSTRDLFERVRSRLPSLDYVELLGGELMEWIGKGMERYHRRLFFDSPLLRFSTSARSTDVMVSHRWSEEYRAGLSNSKNLAVGS